MKDINILGIETSCDETSCAVVKNGREVLSSVVSTQIKIHERYGGVVPEIASRKHVELIMPVIDQALKESGLSFDDIDAITVANGPGLVGALLVGVCVAKALAFALEKPLVAVNHIEGHIAANYIKDKGLKPPFICLVASGGHSHVVYVKSYLEFEVLGRTRDDAVGEAYDKVARTLGLGYPGGPKVDKLAQKGEVNIKFPKVKFPKGSLDFSFSGVKTSVLNYINRGKQKGEKIKNEDVAASFQKAVIDILVENTLKASEMKDCNVIAIAGGVSANSYLRSSIKEECEKRRIKIVIPDLELCTDNAAMIGSCGYFNFVEGRIAGLDLNAIPNLSLD